jgi:hypothetical protein
MMAFGYMMVMEHLKGGYSELGCSGVNKTHRSFQISGVKKDKIIFILIKCSSNNSFNILD